MTHHTENDQYMKIKMEDFGSILCFVCSIFVNLHNFQFKSFVTLWGSLLLMARLKKNDDRFLHFLVSSKIHFKVVAMSLNETVKSVFFFFFF